MIGITKWKPLELLLHRKRVNQKQCHIPWGVAEISVTIKYPKVTEVVILTISPFNLPIWCVQKTAGSCRMAVGYCKLSQGVTPTAIAVPDVVPLLEQINSAFPCTWYVEISLANAYFSIPISENHQKQFIWSSRVNGVWSDNDRDASWNICQASTSESQWTPLGFWSRALLFSVDNTLLLMCSFWFATVS